MQSRREVQTCDGDEAIPSLQVSQGCGRVGHHGLNADMHRVPFRGRNMSEGHPYVATWSLDNLRLIQITNKRLLNTTSVSTQSVNIMSACMCDPRPWP